MTKLQEEINLFLSGQSLFKDVMQWAYHDLQLTTIELAEYFEVSTKTIERWYKGTSIPAKTVQKLVAQYFLELLEKQGY